MKPLTEVRVHIGAPWTATTHLQDVLAAVRTELGRHDAAFGVRDRVRAFGLPPAPGLCGWRYRLGGRPAARLVDRAIEHIGEGRGTIILSEEHFLAVGRDTLATDVFFPRAERRLATLAGVARRRRLKLFLSIRSQANFFPAAYAERISRWPLGHGFETIREGLARRVPSWHRLVERIRATLPQAELHVWTFEDYIRDPEGVIRFLLGRGDVALPRLPLPDTAMRLTRPMVEAIERLPRGLPARSYREEVRRIVAAGAPGTLFAPLDAAERERLSLAYRADLAAIRASGIPLYTPPAPEEAPLDLRPTG